MSARGGIWAPDLVPNLDSVEEFRLITNSFDAEYGKFSGAVMNAITKSGTQRVSRGRCSNSSATTRWMPRTTSHPSESEDCEAQSIWLHHRRPHLEGSAVLLHRLSRDAAGARRGNRPRYRADSGERQGNFDPCGIHYDQQCHGKSGTDDGRRPLLGASAFAAAGLHGNARRAIQRRGLNTSTTAMRISGCGEVEYPQAAWSTAS